MVFLYLENRISADTAKQLDTFLRTLDFKARSISPVKYYTDDGCSVIIHHPQRTYTRVQVNLQRENGLNVSELGEGLVEILSPAGFQPAMDCMDEEIIREKYGLGKLPFYEI